MRAKKRKLRRQKYSYLDELSLAQYGRAGDFGIWEFIVGNGTATILGEEELAQHDHGRFSFFLFRFHILAFWRI